MFSINLSYNSSSICLGYRHIYRSVLSRSSINSHYIVHICPQTTKPTLTPPPPIKLVKLHHFSTTHGRDSKPLQKWLPSILVPSQGGFYLSICAVWAYKEGLNPPLLDVGISEMAVPRLHAEAVIEMHQGGLRQVHFPATTHGPISNTFLQHLKHLPCDLVNIIDTLHNSCPMLLF